MDKNAAKNILDEGQRLKETGYFEDKRRLGQASGGDGVRLAKAIVKEAKRELKTVISY